MPLAGKTVTLGAVYTSRCSGRCAGCSTRASICRAEGKSATTFARMAGVDWGCTARRRYGERSAPGRACWERRTMDRGGGAGRLAGVW